VVGEVQGATDEQLGDDLHGQDMALEALEALHGNGYGMDLDGLDELMSGNVN
jgi:hypothetical protein